MRERLPECPKCGQQQMEVGFVLDLMHGWIGPATWVEGPPEKSFWTGLKLKGRRRIPLSAHRCARCGFVEFYAREEQGPQGGAR